MKKICKALLVATITASSIGCAKIPTTVKLTSIDLGTTLLQTVKEGTLDAFAVGNCSSAASTSYVKCTTPTNLTGEAWYTGLMVGSGSTGYSVGPLVGEVENPSSDSTYKGYAFDASTALEATGKMTCCGGSPYPSDSEAIIQYFQMYPVFIDAKFIIDSGTVAGTHTLRVYFSPVGDYQKGDVLYKGTDGSLKWCVAGSGCTATTRPSSPVQYAAIKNFTNTGQGHATVPALFIKPASGQANTTLTSSAVGKAKSFTATVSLKLNQFVAWSTDPTTATTLDQLAQYFRYNLSDSFTSSATGMTATWEVSTQ